MYGKMLLVKRTNYSELVVLCGIHTIMRKRPNYAQNYACA